LGDTLKAPEGSAHSGAVARAARSGAGVATLALDPTLWSVPDDAAAIPVKDGVAIDLTYPVLKGWIHPVAGATELVPTRWQRKFAAPREGNGGKNGCRRGRHCGLDLDGPRGRTIVSVAAGTVIHVERRRNGKDGHSGRYVRIEHAGGVFTAYMHLDSIAPGLVPGAQVEAGQFIGRLGKSGIRHGDPHLHFNLELPAGARSTRYIDATPFLQRSRVIADPAPKREDNSRKS
jgi:murein DD-endopeptidase MepM/ murein hydrolase activator NlpD